MFVYKKLKPSDVSITPFEAHKQYNYDSSSAGNNGITFSTAYWTSESKAHYSQNNIAGNYLNHRKYFQLDKVFYRDYIIDHGNLIPDVDYIDQERRLYDKVNILSIPQGLFGNRIQPTTFNLTGSFNGDNTIIEIKDDGKGNIYPTTYTLGSTNWPSEKGRIVYIGPVKGFKKKDLTVIPGTGNILVNGSDTFSWDNVYDDSYYLNQVDYNKITFTGDTPLTFINTGEEGYLRLDHSELYNFGFEDDFSISFYLDYNPDELYNELYRTTQDSPRYRRVIAKADVKTIVPSPGEGRSEIISTFNSGNLQLVDVPSEDKFPFKIELDVRRESSTPLGSGSLRFIRSNGEETVTITDERALFSAGFGTFSTLVHICCQKSGSELNIYRDGVKVASGSDLDPNLCKGIPPTNAANVYVGMKATTYNDSGNFSQDYGTNFLGYKDDIKLSQLMIWDSALSETQIQNISESITGTPYIGNVFYDEGFITINHPSYSDIFQQYSGSYSETITLNPTYGDEFNHDVSDIALVNPVLNVSTPGVWNASPKFSFDPLNYTSINATTTFNGLSGSFYTFSPNLETSLGNITIGEVNKEVVRFDFMTASSFTLLDTTKQPFIPSGSSKIRQEVTTHFPYAFLTTDDVEVSESVNILIASNSQNIISDNLTGAGISINDTVFDFGNNPVGVINFNGEYLDSTFDGLHLIGGEANNIEGNPYEFRGRLIRIGSYQTSGTGDEDWNKCTFNFGFNENTVFGIETGSEFNATPNHSITFLQNFDTTETQALKFEVTGSVISLEQFEGDRGPEPVTLYLGYTVNGGGTDPGSSYFYQDDGFTGGEFKASFVTNDGLPVSYQDFNQNDEVELWIKIEDWDSSGNTYQWQITRFAITEPAIATQNIFQNKPVVTSSFELKKSASYDININGLDPANDYASSEALGLQQTEANEDLGVRVTIWKRELNPTYPSYGNEYINYTQLTSSFYASGSDYTNNTCSFTYMSDPNGGSEGTHEQIFLAIQPGIDSTTDGKLIGISQSFGIVGPYIVTEISGSNELYLDTSLGANYADPQYNPIITFGTESGSISGSNPVSINSISSDVVTVADEYLITGSIPATASYFVKQKISASANLDITTSSLFTIENFYLGITASNPTNDNSFATYASSSLPNGVNPRVRFYSGSNLIETVIGGSGTSSIETLHLGYINSGSTLGIHLDAVDSSNTPVTNSAGDGFSLDELQITGISSSITLSLSASSTNFDPELTHLQFTSPHSTVGSTNLPFTTGDITASVTYINENTVTLDSSETLLFTTESLGTVKMIASSSIGFPINISWIFEGGGDGSIYKFDTGSTVYQVFDIIKSEGDSDPNEGLTLFITDPSGNIISSSFIDSASMATTNISLSSGNHFTSSISGTFLVELKTTDSQSNEIPVTWDVGFSNLIASYDNPSLKAPVGDFPFNNTVSSPVLSEISGSRESKYFSGYASFTLQQQSVDMFQIQSVHTTTGSFTNSPFTAGNNSQVQGDLQEQDQALPSGYNILFDVPLLITESSYITGGFAQTQYYLTQVSQSVTSQLPMPILEGNFNVGNNNYNIESIDGTNFIIDQPLLITGSTDVTLNYHTTASNDFTLKFKNTHLIFEHEYQCSVDEEEFNYTQNVSVKKNKSNQSADLADCVTGSLDNSQITLFKPYTTTVGLYDDDYNLLAVGKFAQPIKMSEETDMTFVIRWDS